jgi:hypothetical protein
MDSVERTFLSLQLSAMLSPLDRALAMLAALGRLLLFTHPACFLQPRAFSNDLTAQA